MKLVQKKGKSIEVVTVFIALLIYTAWILLTWNYSLIPIPVLFLAGGLVICWHGSLQHECIHGHPTSNRYLNALVGYLPLGLVIPYPVYFDLHSRHHKTEKITDPFDDPESFYYSEDDWLRYNPLLKLIVRINNTCPGRLIVGPFLTVVQFMRSETLMLFRGDKSHLLAWLLHLPSVILILAWLSYAGMPFWLYLLCFVYPGISFTLLRSFAEHRPGQTNETKSVIIESNILMRLLYLNNNFHYIHHQFPGLAWYKIPGFYFSCKADVLEKNGQFFYSGYLELFRKYSLNLRDLPIHPKYRK